MLIALNNEEFVEANRKLSKEESYQCPSCKSRVHLKVGAVMRPHFAHYQNSSCDVFSEGETEEHIQGKMQLKEWLETQNIPVELEAYLPELKQRPDLLVTLNNQKIALEFQCSGISIEKVAERTKGYLNHGYCVIWILGENFTYKQQLTAFQKSCLTNLDNQLVLFHYSVSKKRLEYRYHFALKQNKKMDHSKKSLKFGQPFNLYLDKQNLKTAKPVHTEMEHMKLLRQLTASPTFGQTFLQLLYDNHETVVSMPKEVYHVVPHEWLLQENAYEWKMQFIYWLEQKKLNTVITMKQLKQFSDGLSYHMIPQASPEQKLKPLLEFVEILTQADVLRQIRFDKWTIYQFPKRYKYLEDKFEGK